MPREMYGRRKGKEGFYDSVFEKPDMWEKGMDNGVGKDVWGMIQWYLKGDLFWFHIRVKRNIFHTFCKEMEAISDQVVILPFWCLCDGLETEKGKIHKSWPASKKGLLNKFGREKCVTSFPQDVGPRNMSRLKMHFIWCGASSTRVNPNHRVMEVEIPKI
ncbi:uncharacterized protein TNCV_2010161 [Trichonephila clavipes]|nr:uncharacterized protein TNCV_2010161 [Trichonephila clavipes]